MKFTPTLKEWEGISEIARNLTLQMIHSDPEWWLTA